MIDFFTNSTSITKYWLKEMKEKSIEFCNKPQHVLRSCGKLLLRLLTAVLEFHHYYTLLFLPLQFGFLFSILGKYKTFKGHWILTCFGLSRPKREGNKRADLLACQAKPISVRSRFCFCILMLNSVPFFVSLLFPCNRRALDWRAALLYFLWLFK